MIILTTDQAEFLRDFRLGVLRPPPSGYPVTEPYPGLNLLANNNSLHWIRAMPNVVFSVSYADQILNRDGTVRVFAVRTSRGDLRIIHNLGIITADGMSAATFNRAIVTDLREFGVPRVALTGFGVQALCYRRIREGVNAFVHAFGMLSPRFPSAMPSWLAALGTLASPVRRPVLGRRNLVILPLP